MSILVIASTIWGKNTFSGLGWLCRGLGRLKLIIVKI